MGTVRYNVDCENRQICYSEYKCSTIVLQKSNKNPTEWLFHLNLFIQEDCLLLTENIIFLSIVNY